MRNSEFGLPEDHENARCGIRGRHGNGECDMPTQGARWRRAVLIEANSELLILRFAIAHRRLARSLRLGRPAPAQV